MELENNFKDIKIRQLRIGEIMSLSWKIFSQNIKPLFFIVLIVYAPLLIINLLIPYDNILIEYGENGVRLTQIIFRLINNFVRVIGLMALVLITDGGVHQLKYTYNQALQKSFSRWGAMLVTGFLAGLIILGFTLLLVIPGIIRSIYYSFIVFVVILRNINGKTALDYSKNLVEGQWWRVFGFTLFFRVIGTGIGIVMGLFLLYIPDLLIIDLMTYIFAEIIDVYFIVALTVFFLNIDYLKNINPNNNEEQSDTQLVDSTFTP